MVCGGCSCGLVSLSDWIAFFRVCLCLREYTLLMVIGFCVELSCDSISVMLHVVSGLVRRMLYSSMCCDG
jgi:hypothetical protein